MQKYQIVDQASIPSLPSECFLPPSSSPPPSIFDTSHISGRKIQTHPLIWTKIHFFLNFVKCAITSSKKWKGPSHTEDQDGFLYYPKHEKILFLHFVSWQLGNDLLFKRSFRRENPEMKSSVHSRSARGICFPQRAILTEPLKLPQPFKVVLAIFLCNNFAQSALVSHTIQSTYLHPSVFLYS